MSRSVEIIGTGACVPGQAIPNSYFAHSIAGSEIERKTGIRERRWAAEHESASDLATAASLSALQEAGIDSSRLDMIIVSSTSPDFVFPATAVLLQKNLGARPIPSFDIQASCSGFLFALSMAENFLKSTGGRLALVASGEIKSRTLDTDDPGSSILFGDGGGAVLLSQSGTESGFRSFHLHTEGTKSGYIQLPGGGSRMPASVPVMRGKLDRIRMKGSLVYRSAIRYFEEVIREALSHNRLTPDDIGCFIFHQANLRLLERIVEKYRIPENRVEISIRKYGNTSSASLPITLDQAAARGNLKKGDLILLATFGGGMTWGSALYKW